MGIKKLFTGSRKHFWPAVLIVAALDQVTKILFFDVLPLEPPVVVISNFFNIVRRTNPAAAFSLGPESPVFYVIVTIVGMLALVWLLAETPPGSLLPVLGLGAVGGGAVGNLIDRIYLGEVRDFLDLHWYGRLHWPAFNLADAAICIGVVIVLAANLRGLSGKAR